MHPCSEKHKDAHRKQSGGRAAAESVQPLTASQRRWLEEHTRPRSRAGSCAEAMFAARPASDASERPANGKKRRVHGKKLGPKNRGEPPRNGEKRIRNKQKGR